MVNGYDIAGDRLGCDVWDLAKQLQQGHANRGVWDGNAIELLAGFFAVVRGWRGLYDGPHDGDGSHREAQSLYEAVRRRLLEHPEEVELVAVQAAATPPGGRPTNEQGRRRTNGSRRSTAQRPSARRHSARRHLLL